VQNPHGPDQRHAVENKQWPDHWARGKHLRSHGPVDQRPTSVQQTQVNDARIIKCEHRCHDDGSKQNKQSVVGDGDASIQVETVVVNLRITTVAEATVRDRLRPDYLQPHKYVTKPSSAVVNNNVNTTFNLYSALHKVWCSSLEHSYHLISDHTVIQVPATYKCTNQVKTWFMMQLVLNFYVAKYLLDTN